MVNLVVSRLSQTRGRRGPSFLLTWLEYIILSLILLVRTRSRWPTVPLFHVRAPSTVPSFTKATVSLSTCWLHPACQMSSCSVGMILSIWGSSQPVFLLLLVRLSFRESSAPRSSRTNPLLKLLRKTNNPLDVRRYRFQIQRCLR